MNVKLNSWQSYKQFIDERRSNPQYLEDEGYYYLMAFDGSYNVSYELDKDDTEACEDFETNYKPTANANLSDKDDTGRDVVRTASTDKGWAFKFHCVELTTAKANGHYSKNWKGEEAFSNVIYKFFDDTGAEVDPSMATKSVLTLDLGDDYDIIAGSIMQYKRPELAGTPQDVRLYTLIGIFDPTGTPFDPDGPGTAWKEQVTEFVGGINLKFVTDKGEIETDGRSGKKLFRVVNSMIPFNQNQIQIIVNHPAGFQHDIQMSVQYYREV